ncbi:hypothetical protein BDN72DRAFT_903785 [Pluteus cervinus]|uniref:Uncharacterized protein n=1 Tax=Pluteus cervinus TaxID=181527 RepID=A0ACD3AAD9_9AGAR|nr:hypothetical protein BDN72DRAFT_903785 [Pluteus cervinus]
MPLALASAYFADMTTWGKHSDGEEYLVYNTGHRYRKKIQVKIIGHVMEDMLDRQLHPEVAHSVIETEAHTLSIQLRASDKPTRKPLFYAAVANLKKMEDRVQVGEVVPVNLWMSGRGVRPDTIFLSTNVVRGRRPQKVSVQRHDGSEVDAQHINSKLQNKDVAAIFTVRHHVAHGFVETFHGILECLRICPH